VADPNSPGVYVIDNTDEGSLISITAQLRKSFDFGLGTALSYSYLQAKNQLSSTEIAQFLWEFNPVQGDPNKPELSFSEFGNQHRFVGVANYKHNWTSDITTSIGLFFEIAQGAPSTAGARSRFSFTYAGDVNGDGVSGNDLIYIPKDRNDIVFDPAFAPVDEQWEAFDAFIKQDDYLNEHRGEISERNGGINPWFSNIDLRILQDFSLNLGGNKHTFQINFDILNLANFLNSDWGVRKIVNTAARTPLVFTGQFDPATGKPIVQYPGVAKETFIDDPSLLSRWRMQIGLRYFFN
jgi:hypothetical protein